MKKRTQGIVFDLRRFSVNDGPGIRTTFFLQGCHLDCWWCHNPEGRPLTSDIEGLAELKARHCASAAGGRPEPWWFITADEVVREAEKDRLFYEESGGGVTFSGGEPFNQPEFLLESLKACHDAEIHTAVDTTGSVESKLLAAAAKWTDLFLYDVKIVDPARHRRFIGVPNDLIQSNLRRLNDWGKAVDMRVPLIPGYTDDEANIEALIALAAELPCIRRVHLLPFHRLGEAKYLRLGLEDRMAGVHPPAPTRMDELRARFTARGIETTIGG